MFKTEMSEFYEVYLRLRGPSIETEGFIVWICIVVKTQLKEIKDLAKRSSIPPVFSLSVMSSLL